MRLIAQHVPLASFDAGVSEIDRHRVTIPILRQLRHVRAAHVLCWKTTPAPSSEGLRENEVLISPPPCSAHQCGVTDRTTSRFSPRCALLMIPWNCISAWRLSNYAALSSRSMIITTTKTIRLHLRPTSLPPAGSSSRVLRLDLEPPETESHNSSSEMKVKGNLISGQEDRAAQSPHRPCHPRRRIKMES